MPSLEGSNSGLESSGVIAEAEGLLTVATMEHPEPQPPTAEHNPNLLRRLGHVLERAVTMLPVSAETRLSEHYGHAQKRNDLLPKMSGKWLGMRRDDAA